MPKKPKPESEVITAPVPVIHKPLGRPSDYTESVATEICGRLAAGDSLLKICADMELNERTIYSWLAKNDAFQQSYTQARANQAERYAEEIVHIADTEEDPNKARNRIDARKWVAAKLLPKKYGDIASLQVNIDKQQLMIVMPTAAEATNRVRQLQAPVIEAEVIEPE